jgi:hypothetical protein
MAEFVFVSPGAKFRERDLTFVTRNVGITTLGVVGETLKGPAFQPIFIQDKGQFRTRFGAQSIERFPVGGNLKYQLPYVANSFLEETNQLYVTRVLGLSGYDAGTGWALTLSAGVDPATVETGTTTTGTESFTNSTYLGNMISLTGQTGTTFTGFTKAASPATTFHGVSKYFVVTAFSASTGNGTVSYTGTTVTGSSYAKYENMVLAVIRSRGTVKDNVNLPPTTSFYTTSVTLPASGNTTLGGTGNLFGQFNLVATSGTSVSKFSATLNPNSSSFLPNVIGSLPKDKNTKIWIQATYPDLIQVLDSGGDTYPTGLIKYGISGVASHGYGVNSTLLKLSSDFYTDYKVGFQTPETPWVVSQLKGSAIDRLFKFVSISDGDAANQEIKISIQNIDPIQLQFDVIIRDFNDTDANPIVLESYTRCSLIQGQTTFIGQRIGTVDGVYDIVSNYVMVELAENLSPDMFPAGFEGYYFNNYAASATTITGTSSGIAPQIYYKTAYGQADNVRKIYLGLSENGYSTASVIGSGINQNMFNFTGQFGYDPITGELLSHVKSRGFHMDSAATGTSYADGTISIGTFETGAGKFQTIDDILEPTNPYFDIKTRKFTLVPAGGFDGWDVNRGYRSYGNLYNQGAIFDGVAPQDQAKNDFQAWQTAVNTYSNPEEVTINLFATPGIDWSNNTVLVTDTIDMLENERADTLYVIDSPLIGQPQLIGQPKQDVLYATDVAGLLNDTGIDSSYSCTYFPWIQVIDTQNNVNVYLPPTGEVVKAMAFTDNTAFPWFAPAGLNRGVTDARKSMFKLSQNARDVLYRGRINPLADFADAGTAIFGQKTLQLKESALDRINVRRLLLQIKVLIANIAIRLVFEQGDQTTIDQFITKSTPLLDTIKRERGLNDYKIKMDNSNNSQESMDRNELYGDLYLKPTRAVEFIGITFTITPSGASFADIGA